MLTFAVHRREHRECASVGVSWFRTWLLVRRVAFSFSRESQLLKLALVGLRESFNSHGEFHQISIEQQYEYT